AVLDREERDQDDGNAVMEEPDVGCRYVERRRVAGSECEAPAADLRALARRTALWPFRALAEVYFATAMLRTVFHSSSRTGATDSRDWRISSILASFGSTLISASV